MRTTLDIDPDVLETAKEIAKKEKKSTGTVISEFARRGFYAPSSSLPDEAVSQDLKNGVPILPPTGSLVTEASIRKIRDSEGI